MGVAGAIGHRASTLPGALGGRLGAALGARLPGALGACWRAALGGRLRAALGGRLRAALGGRMRAAVVVAVGPLRADVVIAAGASRTAVVVAVGTRRGAGGLARTCGREQLWRGNLDRRRVAPQQMVARVRMSRGTGDPEDRYAEHGGGERKGAETPASFENQWTYAKPWQNGSEKRSFPLKRLSP
jgi:hypothetical protein